MRIECESCGAKYSIADEKIIGKLFKVRCKKCSHMIMVDGTQLAGPDEAEEATRVFDVNAAAQAAEAGMLESSDAVWYVVIDGAQTGPLTAAQVEQQFSSGSIDAASFTWREGMDDWIELKDVPEFAAIAGGGGDFDDDGGFDDESTRVVSSAAEHEYNFGAAKATAAKIERFPTGGLPAQPVSIPRAEVARPAATSGSSELFGGTPRPAQAPHSSPMSAPAPGRGDASLGQRNESSVLFSLSDLTASPKANKANDDLPRTEGSGLIDIRVLASSAAPAGGAAPQRPATIGMAAIPVAPLIPVPARRSNTGLMVGIGVGVTVILGLVAAIVVILMRPDPVVQVPVAAAPSAESTPEAAAAAPAAADPAPVAAAEVAPTPDAGVAEAAVAEGSGAAVEVAVAPTEAGEPAAAGTQAPAVPVTPPPATTTPTPVRVAAAEPAATPARTERTERAEPTREREPAAAATPPSTDRERPRGDAAVNTALSAIGRRTEERTEPAATPPTRERPSQQAAAPAAAEPGLSRNEVQSAIRRYGSAVSACRQSDDQAGTYQVRFVIQPSGGVTNVASQDRGDVGRCLVNVVRDMSFPSFSGDPVPVTYPFRL